ncbi:uncharacterized protein K452DRAFT_359694 [Aplosporella prunicola CBS 121167]|uniref:TECPR1-like DysF domain-containing protein n=1 Tax=Aplosporella prunicola CBS 121167 TaxID=1176127 RepID=A0A6A6BBN3_9PEZI|nr:uncharacterized protein K452DRAFT_359694 [Aplosporella prunicola CBS 121167]KAF2140664.1 hypothetical protein K452DRAFT_359694 [Aplosporella prunicola CBS 121167]
MDPRASSSSSIPIVTLSAPHDDGPSGSGSGSHSPSPSPSEKGRRRSRRDALRHSFSGERLKEKLEDFASHKPDASSGKPHDRLLNMLLQQMIPTEGADDDQRPKDRRSRKYVERPGFSIPAMSANFRRFNARIGVVFVFQNRIIRLFSWKDPTHTLSFLAIYSFVCLDPNLLAVLPLAACLFFVMVPSFLARHPPPPSHLPTDRQPLHGPPIAPPQNIKPAPEFSKDFWRNMRDLQNSMEDFSKLHDTAVAMIAPPTNFSNESLSTAIYLLIFVTSCALFIAAHLLPWRLVALVAGWVAVGSLHPKAQAFLESLHVDSFVQEQSEVANSWLNAFANSDIDLSRAPEQREVEVFELQRRANSAPDAEFEPFLFSNSSYTPLSPTRIAGDRPRGTRFFEDVQPPRGWRWADKKWVLDLMSREWVEDRCVTGVEVEVEGERWVSDIHYETEVIINEEMPSSPAQSPTFGGPARNAAKSWEESNGLSRKGMWRRRRWVRLVERRPIPPPEDVYMSSGGNITGPF